MKKIKLGLFYGYELYVETDNKDIDWVKEYKNWIESEKKKAIQEYKDEQTISWMERQIKNLKNKYEKIITISRKNRSNY